VAGWAALAQDEDTMPDLELDGGPRQEAEPLSDLSRKGDLTFGGDRAFHGVKHEALYL
jgi:hypothetical protein